MYRNCSEHTVINEMLKYGEPLEPKAFERRKRCADEDGGAVQICYVSDEDFAEICFERKSKKMIVINDNHLLVEEGGFEPPKSLITDLQSAPFGHSGTPPCEIVAE